MKEKTLPFCCPICGRTTDYPIGELTEGAVLVCPFCKLRLTLHGHMWQDVQKETTKLTKKIRDSEIREHGIPTGW